MFLHGILCQSFLFKLTNDELRDFLAVYEQSVLDESTQRKNYIEASYKVKLNGYRSAVGDNIILFSVDKTTYSKSQVVANYIMGI